MIVLASQNNAVARGDKLIVYADIDAKHHEQTREYMRGKYRDFSDYENEISEAFALGFVQWTGNHRADYETAYHAVKNRRMEQLYGKMEASRRRS
jgi:hypothetical protein